MPARHFYQFGPYRLDLLTRRLVRGDEPVPLTPKAFDTLLVLVRNRERTVDKSELMKALWPDTFVEESNLTQQIFTLRKLLGEQPSGRPYIETVPKHGYHFAAPVVEIQDDAVESLRPWPARGAIVVVLMATALGAGGWWLQSRERSLATTSASAPAPVRSLVVLPFVNLSGDPEQEYVSDGLTEEMITQLSRLDPKRLRVIARASAMQYKATRKNASEIGRELGVDYILEGSVRREGARVRVSAQLVRASDQMHVWAQNYTRDLRSLLEVQSDVAQAIADHVEITLVTPARTALRHSRTVDPEAHQLYLKGRYFWNKRSPEGARTAIDYFEQALEVDPKYALAWVGIANCYFSLPEPDMYKLAESAARKALEIDATVGAAHHTLAFVALHRLDWRGAEEGFRRALELDPVDTGYYGEYLLARGRFDEAIELTRKGLRLDPVSVVTVHGAGINFYYARQYELAVEQFQKAIELDPTYRWSRLRLGYTLAQQGKYQEAVAELQRLGSFADPALAYVHALMGNHREARKPLGRVLSGDGAGLITYEIALIYTALGDVETALKWLNTAAEKRHYHMIYLGVDPKLDPLRADPRFQEMLRRLGPPQSV